MCHFSQIQFNSDSSPENNSAVPSLYRQEPHNHNHIKYHNTPSTSVTYTLRLGQQVERKPRNSGSVLQWEENNFWNSLSWTTVIYSIAPPWGNQLEHTVSWLSGIWNDFMCAFQVFLGYWLSQLSYQTVYSILYSLHGSILASATAVAGSPGVHVKSFRHWQHTSCKQLWRHACLALTCMLDSFFYPFILHAAVSNE